MVAKNISRLFLDYSNLAYLYFQLFHCKYSVITAFSVMYLFLSGVLFCVLGKIICTRFPRLQPRELELELLAATRFVAVG